MATANEVMERLNQVHAENREDHKGISERLDKINGKVQQHELKIMAIENTQVVHEGRLGIADTERKKISKTVETLSMSKKQMAALISVVGAATIAFFQYVVPAVLHLFESKGSP